MTTLANEVRLYQPAAYQPDPDETVECPSCQSMNDADAGFCDQCDYPLKATEAYMPEADETVQCPECKCMNDADAIYCDQCGIRLEGRPDVVEGTAEPMQEDQPMQMDSRASTKGESRRENLVRARPGDVELRAAADGTGSTQMVGIFSRYNQWYEIFDWFEGEFLERVAPGAFTDTIRDDVGSMKVLYDHGFDPSIGNKPLGKITSINDTPDGPFFTVELSTADYVRNQILPLLEGELMNGEKVGSLLGSSMRFEVLDEQWNYRAKVSPENPKGLPERTITRAKVYEFGPVSFPANPGATAQARSRTSEWLSRLQRDLGFRAEYEKRVGDKMLARTLEQIPADLPEKTAAQQAAERWARMRRRADALLRTSPVAP